MRASIRQTLQSKPLLLDRIPIDAVFSLRKLRKNHLLCIRVRRDSDNTELDIGFDRVGNLDRLSLLNFVGAGNGFVSRWYGFKTNFVQQTIANQPTIVRSGTLDTKNGLPAIHQTTSQSLLLSAALILDTSSYTINYIAAQDGTNNKRILSSGASGSNADNWLLGWWNNQQRSIYQNGTGLYNPGVAATTQTQIYTAIGSGSNQCLLYRNGVDFTASGASTSSKPASTLQTNGFTVEASNCTIQEIIITPRAIFRDERLAIENSQKKYYSIT